MKSDISNKFINIEASREEYHLDSPEQLVLCQRIVYSNGFVGVSYRRDGTNGEIDDPQLWDKSMWMDGMIAVLIKTKSGHMCWGWSRWVKAKSFEEFLKKWRYKMNQNIIEMFPATKDAVLVDKWFGREIDKPIVKLLLKGKEDELLNEAKRLENEENEKIKK